MSLKTISERRTFHFVDAASLRDFLNEFEDIDLSTVYFYQGDRDYLSITCETEVLSDGSKVRNIVV